MKTAVYENQIKAMGRTLIPSPEKLLRPAAFFAAGLVLSQFDAVQDISPFTYSALAACPEDTLFACFCGEATGYLIKSGFMQTVFRYLTLCAILGVRLLMKRARKLRYEEVICCVSAAAVPGLCSAARILITGFAVYPAVCAASEAALASACCFLLRRFFTLPFIRIGINRLSRRDSAFVYAGFFILILCASGIKFGEIRPIHIFAMLALLLISHYKGISTGSVCGVALGAALCLQPDARHMLSFFAVGGFAAGLFSRLGQVGCAVSLCISALAAVLFSGCSRESLITLFESAAAGITFGLIPQKIIMKVENYLDEAGYKTSTGRHDDGAALVMKASRYVTEAAQMVEDVFSGMESVSKSAMNRVYADIQQNVCPDCENKLVCWSERFDETSLMIKHIMDGKTPESICCLKTDELCRAAARRKKQYNDSVGYATEQKEMRLIAFDGFRLSSSLLEDAAHRLSASRIYDFSKSDMLTQYLAQNELYVHRLSYSTDLNGRCFTEILTDETVTADLAQSLQQHISRAALKSFSFPRITQTDSYTKLEFIQSPTCEISFGFSRRSAFDGCECGDSIEYFTDADENSVCVISDGMGTGCRAAVDGVLTSTLIKKLSRAGFSMKSIFDFVNSAMIMKSSDESLSTADVTKINVCTGTASFFKAGAAPSYIRQGDEIICVSRPSLPVGIIRGIAFSAEEYRLSNGSIILMLTDGALHNGDEWIREELLAWSTPDMKELAAHIASLAAKKAKKEHRDDITVAALKIRKSK
ncbi:MAG: SpoIIE family protein phosphatase [Clostridia bacterium]|nr:SpoIIE family protein phosphatase [Clostridia bacterium]